MNNTTRAILYLMILQVGFILTQFLSSFGGYIEYLGFYIMMPLLVTELHYRYMRSAEIKLSQTVRATAGLILFWGATGTLMFSLFANYFVSAEVAGFLMPSGLSVILLKQLAVITISSVASLLMYRRISKMLAHRNLADYSLIGG